MMMINGGAHAAVLQPGMFLGSKFRVERLLGQGGMGMVVAATHLELQREVAIKLLLPAIVTDDGIVQRFLREARAQVRIQGDHVVRVLDVGTLPQFGPFMVMELLDGKDLSEVLAERGPLPIACATDFILQAADAIAQAHALGIVHRDLKPQNLFLTNQADGSALVKVLDFGIAKVIDARRSPDATEHGALSGAAQTSAGGVGAGLLGSPAYMSPEQILNPRDVTPLTDIWSLGVILYELFTNRMPFEADTLGGLLGAIAGSEPLDVRVHRPDIPESIAHAVMRCLLKDPNERPRDIAELALAIATDAPSRERALRIAQIVRRLSNRPPPMLPPPLPPPMDVELAATAFAPGVEVSIHSNAAPTPALEWVSTIDDRRWKPSSLRWLAIAGAAIALGAILFGLSPRRHAAAAAAAASVVAATPTAVEEDTRRRAIPPPSSATTPVEAIATATTQPEKPADKADKLKVRAATKTRASASATPSTAVAAPILDLFDSRK